MTEETLTGVEMAAVKWQFSLYGQFFMLLMDTISRADGCGG